jgi:ElaB/YqjD/DUF883 family membrane-anchored ribosome-binding protein
VFSIQEKAMEATEIVTPTFKDGSRTVGRTVEQAASGAHEAIDKISDAARPMVDRIASGAHQALDKIAGVAGQAAETLGVRGEQLKNAQAQAMAQARIYVRENPLTALGIAVAAGYLVSRLVRSR